MERVGIRELRGALAAFVGRAGAGERVVVTVDGRPVAQLGPIEPEGAPTLDALAASGLVEPPRSARRATLTEPVDVPVDVRLERVIAEVRGT